MCAFDVLARACALLCLRRAVLWFEWSSQFMCWESTSSYGLGMKCPQNNSQVEGLAPEVLSKGGVPELTNGPIH